MRVTYTENINMEHDVAGISKNSEGMSFLNRNFKRKKTLTIQTEIDLNTDLRSTLGFCPPRPVEHFIRGLIWIITDGQPSIQ